MSHHTIHLTVNGMPQTVTVEGNQTLLEVLREAIDQPDVKYGCGTGECGACTVLVEDNKPINACLTLAATMDGRSITTVAGLAKGTQLHPVQQAFVEDFAIQCGYCTPGMVLKSVALLSENPNPSEDEIRHYLEGNICRCTGYAKIVKAVQTASDNMVQYAGGDAA
jgi:aerobic carbon-monoxide dehydrogenase small subunit